MQDISRKKPHSGIAMQSETDRIVIKGQYPGTLSPAFLIRKGFNPNIGCLVIDYCCTVY